jgi:multidrug efflux pump subunit AcrA (membrane-fusion protein)
MSCWSETLSEVSQKQDFIVKTQSGKDFSSRLEIEKTGKVSSSQDILLTANANGRVSSIMVKTGDRVQAGQPIALLEDTLWSYGINLDRASNAVERAQISYDAGKLQLDKQLIDTEENLLTFKRNLVNLEKNSTQTLIQAEDSLQNSQYTWLDSRSSLQLEQLDNNIAKSKLDYETKLTLDAETIDGFSGNLKVSFNSLLISLNDVVDFGDELLGITPINKDKNDRYEDFFGSQNSSQKRESEVLLMELIDIQNGTEIQSLQEILTGANMTEKQILETIDFIDTRYGKIKTFLNSLETTLNNSLLSAGQLWQAEVSAFAGQIDGYQASIQGNSSAFISFSSSTKSFLRTYKDTQNSLAQSLELQKKDREIQLKNLMSGEISASVWYEQTLIGIDENTKNLKAQVETAERNLKNARESYDIDLRSLQNTIAESQISYAAALKEFSKLSITSPISGTVSEVFIDKWQEVSNTAQLFNILSDNTPEVEIAFSVKEKDMVKQGQEVYIDIGSERITGKVYAISEVADVNLNYKSTVVFPSGTSLLGNIVTVKIPASTDKMLIPLNIIQTKGQDIGSVQTLSGSTFSEVRIRLGEVFGEYIEVVSCAKNCSDLRIVTNDISNFDENKFVIIEK